MKKYSIFLKIEGWDENVGEQFQALKKIFLKGSASYITEKKIVLAKAQKTSLAVDLSIDEEYLEEILAVFRASGVVDTIDAEYIEPQI